MILLMVIHIILDRAFISSPLNNKNNSLLTIALLAFSFMCLPSFSVYMYSITDDASINISAV